MKINWAHGLAAALAAHGSMGCSSGSDSSDAAPWSETINVAEGQVQAVSGPAGTVALAGELSGPADVGGETVNAGTSTQTFSAGLDRHGKARWVFASDDAGQKQTMAMVSDAAGGLIQVGAFEGTVDFGLGKKSALAQDTFVVRLDASGKTTWMRHFSADAGGPSGAGSSIPTAVVADEQGGVVFAGIFNGTLGFGGAALNASGQGAFITKLDGKGRHVWSRSLGASRSSVDHIAIDADGSLFVTGVSNAGLDIAPPNSPELPDEGTVFVMKLGSDGSEQWSRSLHASTFPALGAMTLDHSGDVILAGVVQSELTLGDFHLDDDLQAFVPFTAAISPAGDPIWLRDLGFDGSSTGAAADSSGNVYLSGFEASGGGSTVGFLRQLDHAGGVARLWRFGARQTSVDRVQPLGSDLLLVGHFVDDLDLGDTALTSTDPSLFVARFHGAAN